MSDEKSVSGTTPRRVMKRRYYTVEEFAALVGCSRSQVYAQIDSLEIVAVKVLGNTRIPIWWADAYLEHLEALRLEEMRTDETDSTAGKRPITSRFSPGRRGTFSTGRPGQDNELGSASALSGGMSAVSADLSGDQRGPGEDRSRNSRSGATKTVATQLTLVGVGGGINT